VKKNLIDLKATLNLDIFDCLRINVTLQQILQFCIYSFQNFQNHLCKLFLHSYKCTFIIMHDPRTIVIEKEEHSNWKRRTCDRDNI